MTEWLNVEPIPEARIGCGAPYPWVRIPPVRPRQNANEAHRPILGEVKGMAFFDGAIAKEIYNRVMNRKYKVIIPSGGKQ